jgi:soluble lytic murein transglycosylase
MRWPALRVWCVLGAIAIAAALAAVVIRPRALAQPPVTPAQPPIASAQGPRTLDPAVVDPDRDTREVRRLLSLGSEDEARATAETALASPATAREVRGRLLWLLGTLLTESGDKTGARARFEELSRLDHPLARWGGLRAAAFMVPSDARAALPILDTLSGDWAGGAEARILRARAQLAGGERAAGIAALRAMLARAGDDAPAAAIAMPLAQELASHASADDREEAVRLLRRITVRLPDTDAARDAEARIKALLPRLPARARARVGANSASDWLALGAAFVRARRYKDAEHAYAQAARKLGRGADCAAEYEVVRAVYQRRERDAAAKRFDRLRKRCKGGDVYAKATFFAGRSYALIGNFGEALRRYDSVVRESPDHFLADDALFRSALTIRELKGKEEEALQKLRKILRDHPSGDMANEARFRLAWAALARGDHQDALELWAEIESRGDTSSEDSYGRAAYWRARNLQIVQRSSEAAATYEQIALRWPLAFYAQLALERLRTLDAGRAAHVTASWGGAPGSSSDGVAQRTASLSIPWRSEFEGPTFARALDLLRVGEPALAEREFTSLGAVGEGADARWTWTAAALFERAGEPSRSVTLLRRRQRYYRENSPIGQSYAEWRLAYPRAFSPLIDDTAAKEGVPAAFVRAIAREESSFTPTAVSPAQAYGMIQVILPTAKRWGSELGITVTPEKLKDPAVNVPVGVHFMQYLWRRYATNPAVVPAAYNAGNAAVDRWLAERGSQPLDEWIENIPYDETQRYTRRVLQSYGVYQWLEDGTLPSRSFVVPPAP